MSSFFLTLLCRISGFFVSLLPVYLVFSGVTSLVMIAAMYYPLNWTKGLSDVGYNFIESKTSSGKIEKIIEIRRRRKPGRLPPVYPNGWFMLMESKDLQPGTVKHISAMGENFAVFRSKWGVSYVLDAYCPHNGANMGVGGKVRGNCLECPFHHWQFNGENGKCTTIPYAKKVPQFAQVKHWESCEVNDFIFVWYHAENEKPSWFLYDVNEIKSKKFHYHGRNEFIVNCHVQDVPENGGDLAHFNAVHCGSIFQGSDLPLRVSPISGLLEHKWTACWEASSQEGLKHLGLGQLYHEMVLFGKFKLSPCKIDIRQVGPGYVEMIINSSFGPVIILQTVTPLEPLVQKVVHRIYCPPPMVFFSTFALLVESIMIERDIMVWNHKRYVDNPMVVSEEQTLVRHRRWFNQFYTENSPRYSTKYSLDW